MHALRNMVNAVKPGGLVLDLQVIRPDPRVEVDSRVVCEIDGQPLFRLADAAAAAERAISQSSHQPRLGHGLVRAQQRLAHARGDRP